MGDDWNDVWMHPHPTLIKSYSHKGYNENREMYVHASLLFKARKCIKFSIIIFLLNYIFYSAYLFISRCNESWLTMMGSIVPNS